MAAFLQKSDPWIEATFVHACSFNGTQSNELPQDESQDKFYDSQQSEWEQTENTIPAGLLPSQPPNDSVSLNHYMNAPSRMSKIVQIIYRGGSGWDGAAFDWKKSCPPYVLLHDGKYSAVAFLGEKAMKSVGMNVIMDNSKTEHSGSRPLKKRGRNKIDTSYDSDNSSVTSNRAERANRRAAARNNSNITLRRNALACITHYTLSTVIQCCSSQRLHHAKVMNELQIPDALWQQLSSQLNLDLMMCIYLDGPITVIGAENQGLIGESVDVHCSPRLRQALRDFDPTTEEQQEQEYHKLMQRLESCHCFYMEQAQKKMNRDNEGTVSDTFLVPAWPWESTLKSEESPAPSAVQGNVADFLLNNEEDGLNGLEMDHILGTQMEEDDEFVKAAKVVVFGRDHDKAVSDQLEEEKVSDGGDEISNGEKNTNEANAVEFATPAAVQQGDAAELFNNYEHLEDVLEFSQDVGDEPQSQTGGHADNTEIIEKATIPTELSKRDDAPLDDTSSTQSGQRIEKKATENAASFVGIDQMIASQTQDSDEDSEGSGASEFPEQPFTQAESVIDDVVEDKLDDEVNEQNIESHPPADEPTNNEKDTQVDNREFIESQDVSLTHSQSMNPEEYFSADEHVIESQIPTHAVNRLKSGKSNAAKKKQVRYSQVPIESQIPVPYQRKQPVDDSKIGEADTTKERYDSDDSWMKVTNTPKRRTERSSPAGDQRSQIAGEGSEENNTPPDIAEAIDFDSESGADFANTQDKLTNDHESSGDTNQNVQFEVEDLHLPAASAASRASHIDNAVEESPPRRKDPPVAAASTVVRGLVDPDYSHTDKADDLEPIRTEKRKVVKQFHMNSFLKRAKRLCRP